MDEAISWIPCLEAVEMVDPDNRHDAMQAIAARAARGIVRSQADVMITETRRYRGNWSKPIREQDAEVPDWYWEKCGNREHPWGPHILGSDMQGRGNNCGRSGMEARVELYGVRFAEPDILSMARNDAVGSAIHLAPPPNSKGKGGAPRDSEKWNAVTLALVQLANEGFLERNFDSRFKSQADLRQAVLDSAALQGFDVKDETIKPLISKIYRAMLA